jgi:hypothetical protein
MHFLLQRAKHVRLVQVVRSGYDYGVNFLGIEELVYVGEDVGNAESLSERSGFGAIVVAKRYEPRAANTREHRKMCKLRYRSRADETKPDVRAQMCPTVVPW